MKTWIKQILRESLDEIKMTQKSEFGSGCFHCVYKSEKNPDRLYKIGHKQIVSQWVNIFKNNPKIFPRVYRVFQSKKKPDNWIVEIEMLNTRNAKRDFEMVSNYVNGAYRNRELKDKKRFGDRYPFTLRNIFELDEIGVKVPEYINVLNDYMHEANASASDRMLAIKWVKTIYSVYKMLGNKFKFNGRDLHSDNVAYDDNENIKIIDI